MYTKNRRGRGGSAQGRRPTHSNTTQKRGRSQNSRARKHGGVARRGSGRPSYRNRGPRKMPTFNPSQFINTNPVDTVEEEYVAKHTFNTFGLNAKLTGTLTTMGIITPTPIQDQVIPEILRNRDVIGLAETGTGKTAAFLLPLIEKTLKDHNRQTLILTPTRELAIQIDDELKKLARGFKLPSIVCVGGINIRPQIRGLRRYNNFIIGTPGRMLDLLRQKYLKTYEISTVVLDEADRMLDMGFIGDIKNIISQTPSDRETLFFSATFDTRTKQLAHEFLRDPIAISVKKKDITNSIEQNVIHYKESEKFNILATMLAKDEFERVIIFGAMKHAVKKLAQDLCAKGIKAESIHGNKSHGQRQRALTNFKNGDARILVATDVAARGIHVENVTHVINYDLPSSFEDYVHRIGRTGRASKKGKALTFVPARL